MFVCPRTAGIVGGWLGIMRTGLGIGIVGIKDETSQATYLLNLSCDVSSPTAVHLYHPQSALLHGLDGVH